jgi:hypothetical protein
MGRKIRLLLFFFCHHNKEKSAGLIPTLAGFWFEKTIQSNLSPANLSGSPYASFLAHLLGGANPSKKFLVTASPVWGANGSPTSSS